MEATASAKAPWTADWSVDSVSSRPVISAKWSAILELLASGDADAGDGISTNLWSACSGDRWNAETKFLQSSEQTPPNSYLNFEPGDNHHLRYENVVLCYLRTREHGHGTRPLKRVSFRPSFSLSSLRVEGGKKEACMEVVKRATWVLGKENGSQPTS